MTIQPAADDSKRQHSAVRHTVDLVVLALTILVAWYLWPAFLGGSSRLIMVQGHSMEPTYATGDLVVLDTDAAPDIGNIIVFRIPDDEPGAGQLVVHRVIGRREDGTYITQGDNSQNSDTFLVTRSDILGSPRFSIPYGGQAIGLLSSPVGIGAALGMLSTALLWPRKRALQPTSEDVAPTAVEEVWPPPTFSEPEMVESQAWPPPQAPPIAA